MKPAAYRLLRPLIVLAAIVILVETWLWERIGPLIGRIVALLPFAAFVAWIGTREPIGAGLAWTVVLINALWVIDSFVLLGWPGLAPTGLGHLFVVVQALAVAALAALQAVALRGRTAGTAPA